MQRPLEPKLYISLHESPFYPGTGRLDERGVGTTVNIPLPAGTSGDVYHWLTEGLVVPSIEAFAPDWLLVSAGYDAHRSDPLARIHLESDDYGVLASLLSAAVAPARTVFFLEGGYDLEALTRSSAATLRGHAGLIERRDPEEKARRGPGWAEARRAKEVLGRKPG